MGYNSIGGGGSANPQDIHEEYADTNAFPTTGESGVIYIAADTNLLYRWNGSTYVEVSPSSAEAGTAVQPRDPSSVLDHTQANESNWTVASGSTLSGHLDELASRTAELENETVDIGTEDIGETRAVLANNTLTPTDITGFSFRADKTRSYHLDIAVERGSLKQSFSIAGVQLDSGFSQSVEKIGDDTGVSFSVTASGQIQYTTTNAVDDASIIYKASTLGVYEPTIPLTWNILTSDTPTANITASNFGSDLTKDAGLISRVNVYAESNEGILSGDGYFKFNIPIGTEASNFDFGVGIRGNSQFGLLPDSPGATSPAAEGDKAEFYIYFREANTAVAIYQDGVTTELGPYSDGDTFTIRINSGAVQILRGVSVIHTFAGTASDTPYRLLFAPLEFASIEGITLSGDNIG